MPLCVYPYEHSLNAGVIQNDSQHTAKSLVSESPHFYTPHPLTPTFLSVLRSYNQLQPVATGLASIPYHGVLVGLRD